MAVPKYDELMKPLLAAVKDGEVYKIRDVAADLAQQLNLSAEDLAEMLPSRRQTVFKNRVGWAKTYLKKAGLLDSPARATIVITETGKQVVAENPEKIDSKYLERFPSFLNFVSAADSTDSNNPIQIRIGDDAMYISNSSLLPFGWTVETLLETHSSKPFNPDIARVFYCAGCIESWGRGIQKICDACKKLGADEPVYIVHDEDIMVKLHALQSPKAPKHHRFWCFG